MVRMGAHVAIADDQRPFGRSTSTYLVTDSQGNEIGQYREESDAGLVLRVTQYVDLDDGRRVTAEFGTLSVDPDFTLAELHEAVREMIFEDGMLDVEAGEQRWEDLVELLGEAGIDAGEAALAALPFVVEIDEAVQRVTL
jgi:hypothetical protein